MIESNWICERCSKEYDLQKGEGWIRLVEEDYSNEESKITPLIPYETVCYECADELYEIAKNCDKNCFACQATIVWGLSVKDCLKFQLAFDLIELPPPPPPQNSIEAARRMFNIF